MFRWICHTWMVWGIIFLYIIWNMCSTGPINGGVGPSGSQVGLRDFENKHQPQINSFVYLIPQKKTCIFYRYTMDQPVLRTFVCARINIYVFYMGVSENRGTPKSSILIGFSIINHPFWGIPIFGNTCFLHLPPPGPKTLTGPIGNSHFPASTKVQKWLWFFKSQAWRLSKSEGQKAIPSGGEQKPPHPKLLRHIFWILPLQTGCWLVTDTRNGRESQIQAPSVDPLIMHPLKNKWLDVTARPWKIGVPAGDQPTPLKSLGEGKVSAMWSCINWATEKKERPGCLLGILRFLVIPIKTA